MTDALDTLRPEVREAINRQDRQEKCDEYCPVCEDRAIIRAELLRLAKAEAELAALKARMGWRPIEAAPDNHAVLAWNGDYLTIALRNTHVGKWMDLCDHPMWDEELPTHWMPLPPPPKGED